MATEIERKFLVRDDSWRRQAGAGIRLRQGYLIGGKNSSIRVRSGGGMAYLNIKGASLGIRRSEYDYPIPLDDAEDLLNNLCQRPLIEKTRYPVKYAGHTWEVDVFECDNAGLVVAEIELRCENEDFVRPAWLGAEVSHDPRYYNVCLVENPFKKWKD